VLCDRPGFSRGKIPSASVHAIKAKMTSRLQLIPMRIPRIVPRWKLEVTIAA
jgi:hypothetical protein